MDGQKQRDKKEERKGSEDEGAEREREKMCKESGRQKMESNCEIVT